MSYNLLERKNPNSYSNDIHDAINIISIDPEETEVFGSFAFKALKFPTDLDLLEEVKGCCSKEDVINKVEKEIKNVVKRIMKSKDSYVSELKAGLDKVYMIDLGEFKKNILSNFDYEQVGEDVTNLYENGYLTEEEYNEIMKYVKPNITNIQYQHLFDLLRDKWIIRWNDSEILKGKKELSNGREITLNQALYDKTLIKLDMWAPINNRYVEVTNFFILRSIDKQGNEEDINLELDIIPDLVEEVLKFMSGLFYKPYKYAKRLWSLSLAIRDIETIKLITPLLNSDASKLNIINSDISVIVGMIERIKKPPINFLVKEIDNFKNIISNISSIKLQEDKLYKEIEYIVDNYFKMEKDDFIARLNRIKEYLQSEINEYALTYMKGVGLYPLPEKFYQLV